VYLDLESMLPTECGMIVCSQPNKLAASSLADRVAYEFSGGRVDYKKGKSGSIGVHVDDAKDCGKYTRIKFVTERILLNEMLLTRQRHLAATSGALTSALVYDTAENGASYAGVILDEVHERSIVTDLLLGLFKERLSSPDPMLRASTPLLIVSSATLDVQKIQDYFSPTLATDNSIPHLSIQGRMFPVLECFTPVPDSASPVAMAAERAFTIHMDVTSDPGDILVFVSGQDECISGARAVISLLNQNKFDLKRKATVLQLYAKQLPEEQAKVHATPRDGARKIIFTTNIAETSVTIDGVTHVVDTGLVAEVIFDHQRNMMVLHEHQISKSSADQRRGRAGRTQPGFCYRLYSEDDYAEMRRNKMPKIFQSPLALEFLQLRQRGIDPHTFPWIDRPDPDDLTAIERELVLLGCLDEATGDATCIGDIAVELELDPKLARLVCLGLDRSIVRSALAVAAILSSGSDVWYNPPPASAAAVKEAAAEARADLTVDLQCQGEGDVVLAMRILHKWESLGNGCDDGQQSDLSDAYKSTIRATFDSLLPCFKQPKPFFTLILTALYSPRNCRRRRNRTVLPWRFN